MIIGYVRVSTIEQNEDRQLVTMEKYKVEKIFKEKVSAKDTNRPQLQEMIKFINNFYEFNQHLDNKQELKLIIHDFSRLSRSTRDLLFMVEYLKEKNVILISEKENIDTSTATGKLMLTMIAAINEFERENLLERQREGIALAKLKGVYKGRREIKVDNFKEYYDRYMRREINKSQMAKELKVSRPTVDKLIREYLEKNN